MISERAYPVRPEASERGITLPIGRYWERATLLLILALSAFLNFWRLNTEGYPNEFYAAAVRSMTENWHAFFFNSFDPAGFVTIDKPPLGFWFQVASAKLFGFSGFSILLPEALAGVLAVAVLYRLVSRTFGKPAGLIAALVLAVTPISVATNRNNTIDSILVLAVLLGAWAVLKAAETGKLRWLLLCAVAVGLGFNIKMLEAFLVLPAFGLMYLLGAQISFPKRLLHLLLAGLVLAVVSLSWVTAVDLTPASQRPWVDSTTTNSALDLAIGYNGIQRLTGNSSVGSSSHRGAAPTTGGSAGSASGGTSGSTSNTSGTSGGTGTVGTGHFATAPGLSNSGSVSNAPGGFGNGGPGGGNGYGPGGVGENGPVGVFRLLDAQLGGQIGWLLPLAVIGFLVAAWQTRPRFRTLDAPQRSLILWGMWLLTMGVFFSIALFYHTYYLIMVGPAISALAGIGIVALWSEYRRAGSKTWWLLPLGLLVAAGVQGYILSTYPAWSRWMTPLIVGGTVLVALVLTALRLRRSLRLAVPVAVVGVGLLLTAPATWAAQTAQHTQTGNIFKAGPTSAATQGGFGGGPGGSQAGGPPGGFGPGQGNSGTGSESGFGFGPPPGNNGAGGPPSGSNGSAGAPPSGSTAGGPPSSSGNAGGPPSNAGGPPSSTGSSSASGNSSSSASSTGSNRFGGFPGGGFGGRGGAGGPGGVSTALITYLEKHQGTATYLVATTSSNDAAPIIIKTGKAVMSMGGFSGSDPILTASSVAKLVKEGVIHYFLLGGGTGGGPGGGNSSATSWVTTHCTVVPSSKYSSSTSAGTSGGDSGLYYCGAKA